MQTTPKKLSRKSTRLAAVAVAGTLAIGVTAASPSAALADYTNGQFVSKSGLNCGGQELNTGSVGAGPAELKQYSWVYYNCGDASARRKADIINDFDGDCYGIGPGEARVLATKYAIPGRNVYRGSKDC